MTQSPELPDFERPPVVEIIAAVQFVPLPQFGMTEAVAVARVFDGWAVVDVPPALAPIVEPPSPTAAPASFNLGLGTPPLRLILTSDDQRWLAQVQQDRVAVHERRVETRPSFSNVAPKLHEVSRLASTALQRDVLGAPELVEMIYVNRIPAGEGWESFRELDRVLRVVAPPAAGMPFDRVERLGLSMSSTLEDDGEFVGRLHVTANPLFDESHLPVLDLHLISRRYVHKRPLAQVLERSHRDIVESFTAITQPAMHEIWGRFR